VLNNCYKYEGGPWNFFSPERGPWHQNVWEPMVYLFNQFPVFQSYRWYKFYYLMAEIGGSAYLLVVVSKLYKNASYLHNFKMQILIVCSSNMLSTCI